MPALAGTLADLARSPQVRACLEWFRRERAWINEHHLKLCRIAAPTFFEQKRAEWIAERFRSLGGPLNVDHSRRVRRQALCPGPRGISRGSHGTHVVGAAPRLIPVPQTPTQRSRRPIPVAPEPSGPPSGTVPLIPER